MSPTVIVTYYGGPLDGNVEVVARSAFDSWVSRIPWTEIRFGTELHLYQSYSPFSDGDAAVDVRWADIVGVARPDDGYDGWLPVEDRYTRDADQ